MGIVAKQAQAWKNLERKVAKALGGERIIRAGDYSQKTYDVNVPDFPELKIDSKYRTSGWKHHTYLQEIEEKYCHSDRDVPVLVTKNKGETGEYVTMKLEHFADFLEYYRRAYGLSKREKSELIGSGARDCQETLETAKTSATG